jgi:hypothetical protein
MEMLNGGSNNSTIRRPPTKIKVANPGALENESSARFKRS